MAAGTSFTIGTTFKAHDKATPTIGRIGSRISGLYAQSKLLNGSFGNLGRSVGGLTSRVKTLGASFAGLASVGGLYAGWNLTKSFAQDADELSKFTRQIGMTVEAYQEWQYVADRQGVSNDEFKKGITGFSKRLGELRMGTGSLHTILKKSNPALMEQLKATSSTEEALDLYMAALDQVKDPADKAALASAAFGGKLAKFTRIAEAGEDGIKALRLEAKSFGLISAEAALNSEGFVDSLANWGMALGGVRTEIGSRLIPVLQPLLESLTGWVKLNRELIGQKVQELAEGFASWLKSIDWQAVGKGINDFAKGIAKFVDRIGGAKNAFIGLAVVTNGPLVVGIAQLAIGFIRLGWAATRDAAKGIWKYRKSIGKGFVKVLSLGKRALFGLGKAFVSVGRMFLMNPIGAAITAIAAGGYLIIKNWSSVKEWFGNMWGNIKNIFGGFGGFLKGVFSRDSQATADGLRQMWEGVKSYFSGLWEGLKATWSAIWNDLLGLILPDSWISKGNEIGAKFTETIEKAFADLKTTIGNLWKSITEVFDFSAWWDVGIKAGQALGEGISSIWQNIQNWFKEKIQSLMDWMPDWVKDKLGVAEWESKLSEKENSNKFSSTPQENPYAKQPITEIGSSLQITETTNNQKPVTEIGTKIKSLMDKSSDWSEKVKGAVTDLSNKLGPAIVTPAVQAATTAALSNSTVQGEFSGGLKVDVKVHGQAATVNTQGQGTINNNPIIIEPNRGGGVGG